MTRYWSRLLVVACTSLAGCTSDPNAPVNQTFPIRQMDNFFDSLAASPPDYTRQPGYAPAYPPYSSVLQQQPNPPG
nr:hypothetical protein [uncultured Rhodopila sp.]